MGQNLSPKFLLRNITGLNLKSLCSTFVFYAYLYVLIVAIRPSVGDVNPGDPLEIFDRSKLMPTSGFFFASYHNTTYTYPSFIFT